MKKRKMKKCSKCKLEKDFIEFRKDKSQKDGHTNRCKSCFKEYENQTSNKINQRKKNYYLDNKSKISQQRKIYRINNLDKLNNYRKVYYIKNKTQLNKKTAKYKRLRRQNNTQFKLSVNLRTRLLHALKGNFKSGSAVRDLGCSIDKFKLWLEMHFQDGMSWDNYGPKGWHIDHKIPISSFNLTNREELLKACHFSNLQPMWAKDNLIKGNRICQ